MSGGYRHKTLNLHEEGMLTQTASKTNSEESCDARLARMALVPFAGTKGTPRRDAPNKMFCTLNISKRNHSVPALEVS